MIATEPESYDVIIIGAGISGINFAYRLQERTPNLNYVILENRDTLGGTWDLFRYPGIRSDSDLHTFSFKWNPWPEKKSIAEAPLILKYMHESVKKEGIDRHIKYRHHVDGASWSSEQQAWTLNVTANGNSSKEFRSRYLLYCTGYYDYETPMQTEIPGIKNFGGKVVHPQFWPADLDYSNKNVVVIGSGATAVTIIPSMAEKASRVTMLQRSPTYILSQSSQDIQEKAIKAFAPTWMQSTLLRMKWILMPFLFAQLCKLIPGTIKKVLRVATSKQLPPNIPVDPHFTPSYNPWQQRLCVCPDGDFYKALRSGKADVVTGTIREVTKDAIRLNDGQELHPDIIITATGLKMLLAGGIPISVDGKPFSVPDKFMWKSMMMQDLPNTFFVIGYVDASWTLGADIAAKMACKIINRMSRLDAGVVVPRLPDGASISEVSVLNLTSTYIRKGAAALPKASNLPQWRPRSSYLNDLWQLMFGDLKSDLQFIESNE